MKDKIIFVVTDITGKVTRSTPIEMDELELMRFVRGLEEFTALSCFSMKVKENGLQERKVYFNPRQLISIGIEEVK